MPSHYFACIYCPLCIINGGHTQPTAFTKLSTVDVSPWSALTVLYKGSFTSPRYTFSVYIVNVEANKSEGEDGEDDGSEQDLCDQFDDIYDDLPGEDNGKSFGDADMEEQMRATSSSESPVQPLCCSTSAHKIKSSNSTSTSTSDLSSSRPPSRDRPQTQDTPTTYSSSSSLTVTGTKTGDAQPPPPGNNAKKVV